MYALTTETAARAAGEKILGYVEAGVGNRVEEQLADVVLCGDRTDHRDYCYLGAEEGYALMGALDDVTEQHAEVMVRCTGARNATEAWLSVVASAQDRLLSKRQSLRLQTSSREELLPAADAPGRLSLLRRWTNGSRAAARFALRARVRHSG